MNEAFHGTNLWKNLMFGSTYVLLIFIVFLMMFNSYLGIIITLVIFGIWFLVAWSVLREEKIKVYQKYGGKKIITGTLGEEDNMGEIVEFEVKRIVPYIDLTEGEKKSIEELIKKERYFLEQLDDKDNVRYALMNKIEINEENESNENDEEED